MPLAVGEINYYQSHKMEKLTMNNKKHINESHAAILDPTVSLKKKFQQ